MEGRDRVIAFHETQNAHQFREKIHWLSKKFKIVSLEKLLNTYSPKRRVSLTFDDGFRSWFDNAVPILKEMSLPAVFFVCSGFVGLTADEARRFVRDKLQRSSDLRPLSRSHLRSISECHLFEIGSHTVNHRNFAKNVPLTSIKSEILRDRKQLEDWTGEKVRWFAYPFGQPRHISKDVKRVLRGASIDGAFTIVPGFVSDAHDDLEVGRDSLDVQWNDWIWLFWLNGYYDTLYYIRNVLIRNSNYACFLDT